jgi:hypothetical protein
MGKLCARGRANGCITPEEKKVIVDAVASSLRNPASATYQGGSAAENQSVVTWSEVMPRVCLVGYDPEAADYSNPAYPPGMSAEKINAGIALALKQTTDRGWDSDVCYIRPDRAAAQTVERHLASANYDCVVIGAGVRLPPQSLPDFEAVINAVHRTAPTAAIAFNTRPEDSADAAARWLPSG